MDPFLAIVAGLIGASFTVIIASRYRTPVDYSDEKKAPRRWQQIQVQTVNFGPQGK